MSPSPGKTKDSLSEGEVDTTLTCAGYSDPIVIDAGDTDVYIQALVVRAVDRTSKNRELKIKEALHIQMTPDNNKFNRDIDLELLGCWLSMLYANHPPGCKQ